MRCGDIGLFFKRRLANVLLVTGGLGAILMAPPALWAQGNHVLHRHVTGDWASPSHRARIARVNPSQVLSLRLVLPLRNQAGLDRLIEQLQDPESPDYHQYLTPEQFTEKFGASDGDVWLVQNFATHNGMEVIGVAPNHAWVEVRASVAVIEKVFQVEMGTWNHPTEARTFYAPDRDVTIADLDVQLQGIEGLDNARVVRPANLKILAKDQVIANATGSGPSGLFIGKDFRAAYAPGVTLTGSGQTVGLFEFGGYHRSDITQYCSTAGIAVPTIVDVSIDGVNPQAAATDDTGEQDLDGEMAISMAPGATIYYYCGNNPDDIMNRMASDNLAKQMSCSFGWKPASSAQSQILAQYAAQGQTFFCATGDSGAFTAGANSANPCWPPADDPGLTAVGGTSLTTTGAGGPWQSETAWNGSSGGISDTFAIPAYQQAVNMGAAHGSTSRRNIPDVAAQADTDIYFVYNNGQAGGVGGTSAAAPLWAGFCALINQQAVANGRANLGNFNQAAYAIGLGTSYSTSFHDITTGNNYNSASPSNWAAISGYDLVTGWGSPDGQGTINAFAGGSNPPAGPITVYQDCNYGGYAVGLTAGTYTTAQLVAKGAKDNDLSSLKIAAGYTVTLYDGDNFTGNSLALTADTSCLVASAFNDITSSIKVVNTAAVTTVYQDCSYGGYAVGLAPGTYTSAQLVALGAKNNDISSLRITSGYTATLYDGDNLTGTALALTADTSCLVANAFNDLTSSIKVAATAPAGAVFYQDINYGGTATQAIPKGSYTLSQLQAYGFVNDWASSVKIPSGWTLIMYANDNFAGTAWTLTSTSANVANFTALSPSVNDLVSSIKLQ